MNNLGGYRSVELVFIDEVTAFIRSGRSARLELSAGKSSRRLPLHDNSASLEATAESDEGGTLYTHQCSIPLRTNALESGLAKELRQVTQRGCLLIGTTNNGDRRVFGSKEYPLLGTFSETYGSRRSDLHQHTLTLSCTCLHPELTLP